MRVTLVGRDFPPRVGGIADHTDRLAAALAQRGHAVTVVVEPPAEARSAFAVHARPAAQIVDAVRRSEPDAIVWQYNPFSVGARGLANGAAPRARALAEVAPLTVFFHELWFPWGRAGLRGAVWALAQRAAGRRVLAVSRNAIVTTPEREADLRGRARRIPVGTNIDPIADDRDAARTRLGIDPDAFVVVHLGSTGPGRDLGPVADAVARVGGMLFLAGDTGPDRPAGAHVRAPGRQEPADLSRALRAADVYLHADPVGASAGRRTTLVAALAHGLPVVAYRGPQCAPELAGAIVEVARDARDVADALSALRADRPRMHDLGARSRQIFDDHFSWRRIAEDVEAVLLSG